MNIRVSVESVNSGVWARLLFVCLMLFFVFLGDAVYSDWVPAYMQTSLGSPLLMGIVMAFSSLAGLLADLVFPQLLKKFTSKKLMLMAILTSALFGLIMLLTVWWPLIALFLTGMVVWGIYYEFLGFGSSEFVSSSAPSHFRTGAWSVLSAFRGLAYFLGPIVGSLLVLESGNVYAVGFALLSTFIGLVVWFFLAKASVRNKPNESEVAVERVSVSLEVRYWWVLFKRVWPVVIISLMCGLLDSTFWTTGTVLSDNMAKEHVYGGLFLPLYELPMVIVGLLVAKMGIYKGKKKLAELFLLIAGLLMIFLVLAESTLLVLVISLLIGVATALCWPLKDAIYTDVVNRMGHQGKHMIGLSNSTVSIAYIIGPILSGALATIFGEKNTFVVIGILIVFVSLLLLIFTPRKMRLPEKEIEAWN